MAVVVSTEGLSKAIAERLKFPGRTEAEVCNHIAYSVAHQAMINTPFVTQGKIDTELGVSTNLWLTKRGKFSRDKRKRTFTGGRMGSQVSDTTLAKLIILARANLLKKGKGQSNYNRITNNRWKLDPDQLKGGSSVIQSFISRMIKSRHSSTKFLQTGWLAAKKALEPFIRKKIMGPVREGDSDLGSASPAEEGAWSVEATIENAVGLQGVNAKNYNRALIQYGTPALMQAIATVEAQERKYIEKLAQKQNDKFNEMSK